jgi:hypothetical protein
MTRAKSTPESVLSYRHLHVKAISFLDIQRPARMDEEVY